MPTLRTVGMVDQEGKVSQDFARKWRDDSQYASLCKEVIQKVYPQELSDAFSDPTADQAGIQRWFANHTGGGESAVTKMSAFYVLLLRANPIAEEPAKKSPGKNIKSRIAASRNSQPHNAARIETPPKEEQATDNRVQTPNVEVTPEIHIDIQIHISPESSAEQIDQIFSSLTKYLGSSTLCGDDWL